MNLSAASRISSSTFPSAWIERYQYRRNRLLQLDHRHHPEETELSSALAATYMPAAGEPSPPWRGIDLLLKVTFFGTGKRKVRLCCEARAPPHPPASGLFPAPAFPPERGLHPSVARARQGFRSEESADAVLVH